MHHKTHHLDADLGQYTNRTQTLNATGRLLVQPRSLIMAQGTQPAVETAATRTEFYRHHAVAFNPTFFFKLFLPIQPVLGVLTCPTATHVPLVSSSMDTASVIERMVHAEVVYPTTNSV